MKLSRIVVIVLASALAVAGLLVAWIVVPGSRALPDEATQAVAALPRAVPPPPTGRVSVSVIRTGVIPSKEALVVEGGSWSKPVELPVVAVLVRHPVHGDLLLDAGLGAGAPGEVAGQPALVQKIMPVSFERTAREQLLAQGFDPDAIRTILVTHLHWDHASGLKDFPKAKVLVPKPELDFALGNGGVRPAFIREQLELPEDRYETLTFDGPPYEYFAASHDLFGDGSAVVVPLPGHTTSHLGLVVTTPSERRYLFIGDLTWSLRGVRELRQRPRASRFADLDTARLTDSLLRVHRLATEDPALMVVPAHDAEAQAALAHLPDFTD